MKLFAFWIASLFRAAVRVSFLYVIVRLWFEDVNELLNWFYGASFAEGFWVTIVVAVWFTIVTAFVNWIQPKIQDRLEQIEQQLNRK